DSAGIRIVLTQAPSPGQEITWVVAERPEITIGLEAGSEEYLLDRVQAAVRLEGGEIAVADASGVRVYDSGGRYRSTLGGLGQGPGEFTRPSRLAPVSDSTIAIFDGQRFRISIFDLHGTLVREGPVQRPVAAGMGAPAFVTDGWLLSDLRVVARLYQLSTVSSGAGADGTKEYL